MKQFKISFLFLSLFPLLLLGINKINAQQKIDSTIYHKNLVENPKRNEDLTNALNYFQTQRSLHKEQNYISAEIYDLIYVSQIQKKIGFLYHSENSAVEALKLLDQLKEDQWVIDSRMTLFNHFGLLYMELGNYESSLDYYDRVLKNTDDPEIINTVLNNIGNVYLEQEQFQIAIDYYNKSYKNSLNYDNKKQIARALDNFGYAQSKIEIPEALTNMTKALMIREEINYDQGIITSFLHLGEYYKNINEKEKAIICVNKALKIADYSNNVTYKRSALSLSIELNGNLRDIEFIRINDSISKFERVAKNEYASIIYDFDKEAKRANENELQTEKEKSKRILYQALGVFVLLLSILAYFITKFKHKKEKIQQVYYIEKRISKKIHDELGNDIFYLMAQIQSNPKALLNNKGVKVLNGLNSIYGKARDIARTYTKIETGDTFGDELTALLNSYGSNDTKIVTTKIDPLFWKSVSNTKKIELYRILQELLTNMKKHSQASFAAVTFTKKQNKVFVNYADNGIGMSKENFKLNNGLSNVESRINAMNGNITFDTKPNEGFKVEIRFTA